MSAILCLVSVPTAPILQPGSDLRIYDLIFTAVCEETSPVTPDFFLQVFAKNSLINNIFEEEKKFFWGKIVPYWVDFGQGEDLKLTRELSEKVQYFHHQTIKNGLNEAILHM